MYTAMYVDLVVFLIISNLIAFHTEFAAEPVIFIKLVLFSHVLKLHLKVVGFCLINCVLILRFCKTDV